MKTTSKILEMVIIVCMLLPLVYLGIVWKQLPSEIVIHYDGHGNPNGWQAKETAALLIGGLTVFLYLVLRFTPQLDPKNQLQTSNYQKLRFVVALFWAGTMGWMFYMANHQESGVRIERILMISVGFLLTGMGNYLTTVRPNWFIGIRTPWTLESEGVWRKTHRLAGRLMVVGGLLSIVLALVVPRVYVVSSGMCVILAVTLIPVIYSYIYFRQEKAHQLN